MSWYTRANFQYLGDEEFNFAEVSKSLEPTLNRLGLSRDVLKDLSNLINQREASFKLHWLSLVDVALTTGSEYARVARPTRTGEAPLLAAQPERWAVRST